MLRFGLYNLELIIWVFIENYLHILFKNLILISDHSVNGFYYSLK